MNTSPGQNLSHLAWYLLTTDGDLSVRVLPGLIVGVDNSGDIVFNGGGAQRLVVFDVDEQGLQFEVLGDAHTVYLNQLPVQGKLSLTLNCHLTLADNDLQFDCRLLNASPPDSLALDPIKIVLPEIDAPQPDSSSETLLEETSSSQTIVAKEPANFGEESANAQTEADEQTEQDPEEDALVDPQEDPEEDTEVIVLSALPEIVVAESPARSATYSKRAPFSRMKIAAGVFVVISVTLAWWYYPQENGTDIKQLLDAVVSPIITPELQPEDLSPAGALTQESGSPTRTTATVEQSSTSKPQDPDVSSQVAAWFDEGDRLLSQGFWTRGRDTAAARYLRVLTLDANNPRAIAGMEIIYAGIMRMSDPVAKRRSVAALDKLIADVPALSDLRQKIGGGTRSVSAATISDQLDIARNLLNTGFITEPNGENAVFKLRKILRQDSQNSAALALLEESAAQLVSAAQEAEAAGLDHEARNLIEEVLAFLPQHEQANVMWQHWQIDQ